MLFQLPFLQDQAIGAVLAIAAGAALLIALILTFLALLIADRLATGSGPVTPGWAIALSLLPAAVLLIPGPQWNANWMTTVYSPLGLLLLLPFGILYLAQTIAHTIPPGIRQTAALDGLQGNETLFSIIIPQIRPALAAFFLLIFVAGWNLAVLPGNDLQNAGSIVFGVTLVGSVSFLCLLQHRKAA